MHLRFKVDIILLFYPQFVYVHIKCRQPRCAVSLYFVTTRYMLRYLPMHFFIEKNWLSATDKTMFVIIKTSKTLAKLSFASLVQRRRPINRTISRFRYISLVFSWGLTNFNANTLENMLACIVTLVKCIENRIVREVSRYIDELLHQKANG